MAYTTAAYLRQYLGVESEAEDVLLSDLIARAQSAIDHYCGRTFESSTDTTRNFEVGKDTDGDTLYLDRDLCSITTVKTDADATSPVTLTANTDYITHPRTDTPYYAIQLLGSSSYSWTYTSNPEMGVTVTGKWAYSTSAPNDIVHATIRLAAYFYKQKDAGVYDTTAIPDAGVIQVPQGIPRDVQLILAPYVRAN